MSILLKNFNWNWYLNTGTLYLFLISFNNLELFFKRDLASLTDTILKMTKLFKTELI